MVAGGPLDTLAAIWVQCRDEVLVQVGVVCDAVADALAGELTAANRDAAGKEAHKLAGSVGSLGFREASQHARELEHALKQPGALVGSELPRLAEHAVALREALLADRPPDASLPTEPEEDAAEPALELAGTRALIVDDDPAFLIALRSVLEGAGLSVSTCESTTEFMDRVAQVGPDIIVLDFEMPGASGAQLCRALRSERRWSWIPVMFITSRTDADTVRLLYESGADDYLTKPLVAADVVGRIKNRLERARQAQPADERGRDRAAHQSETDQGVEQADVVVIEDDDVLARLLVHALESRGYRTHLITDGEVAAAELGSAHPAVTAPVLLLDWDLPGLDGLRLLRVLGERGVLSRSRVIMLTARGTEAEIIQALEAGAADHVTKPFSVPVLMRRVHNALGR